MSLTAVLAFSTGYARKLFNHRNNMLSHARCQSQSSAEVARIDRYSNVAQRKGQRSTPWASLHRLAHAQETTHLHCLGKHPREQIEMQLL